MPIRLAFVYRRGASQSAFTLIELLVVIAIIAILASILFPVFAQARAKARQTANISNLKQIGLAVLQYAQDYDECVVPYRVAIGGSPINNRYWFGKSMTASVSPYNAPPYTTAPCPSAACNVYFDRGDGLITPYTKSVEIQDDPSAKDVVLPNFTNWYNGADIPTYSVYARVFPDNSNNITATTLADIVETASTVMMADGASITSVAGKPVKSIFISPPWGYNSAGTFVDNTTSAAGFASPRLHARHTGSACVAWMDGHVSVARPQFRPVGSSALNDARRRAGLGELTPVALPATITATDPQLLEYNRFFALNKKTGI
ncbi:MAG: prepilin-type N-terminal cleavage/methylation domain-containing protein [Fibrella sp.]|nr:prepilin-type N-terminal cleavage/methylation domain-containing protein [Armatimonadota bacterium]